jgi:Tfp pilus assembly protein PilF
MIVRDEESCLARSLESVRGLVDEVVVVDTGSRDRTRELAARAGARVFELAWGDDFAAARNFSLARCASEWALVLDADEVVERAAHAELRSLAARADLDAVELIQANYRGDPRSPCWRPLRRLAPEARGCAGYLEVRVVRMVRAGHGYEFRGRIHETIVESVRERGGRVHSSELVIHHHGTPPDGDAERARRKRELYARLVAESARERPGEAKAQWQLGEALAAEEGRAPEAEQSLARALALDPALEGARATLAQLLLRRGAPAEAERLLLEGAGADGELSLSHAELLIAACLFGGRLEEAAALARGVLARDGGRPLARLWAGVIAEELGHEAEAAAHYDRAGDGRAGFPLAAARRRSFLERTRARARRAAGDQRGALQSLRAALAADPEDPLVHRDLAALAAEHGDAATAARLLERAAQLAPYSRPVQRAWLALGYVAA